MLIIFSAEKAPLEVAVSTCWFLKKNKKMGGTPGPDFGG
jgi:hypothetical protein